MNSDKKIVLSFASVGAFVASLCCFSPLVLFIVGLASASTAASFSEELYGTYKWHFRAFAFVCVAIAYIVWSKKRLTACSLQKQARERKRLLNLFFLIIILGIVVYLIWNFVILEFVGHILGLWEIKGILQYIIPE